MSHSFFLLHKFPVSVEPSMVIRMQTKSWIAPGILVHNSEDPPFSLTCLVGFYIIPFSAVKRRVPDDKLLHLLLIFFID